MQLSAGAVGRGDSPGGSNRRRADGLKGAGSAPSAGGRRGEGGALARPRAAIFSDRSPRAERAESLALLSSHAALTLKLPDHPARASTAAHRSRGPARPRPRPASSHRSQRLLFFRFTLLCFSPHSVLNFQVFPV